MTNREINKAFKELIEKFGQFKVDVENVQEEVNAKITTSITNFNAERADFTSFKVTNEAELNALKETQENKVNEIITLINKERQRLEEFYSELFGEDNSIENSINELKSEIKEYHDKLLIGDEESNSIKDKIAVVNREIIAYQKELFGTKKKDDDGKVIEEPGLKDEINTLITQYENEIEEFSKKTDELIQDKTEEMNSLLEKMDLNYNAVEQEALSKKFFVLSEEKKLSIRNSTILLTIYSLLLTGSLMFLFTCASLAKLFSDEIIIGSIIRIAITVPIMYLIISTASKIKREISIRDQYNFKGSVMSTYRNVSTHIKNETIPISVLKQTELLEKVFNIILENESDKVDKSNQSGIKYFTKLFGALAKDFGLSKDTLIAILPELLEKVNEIKKTAEKEKQKRIVPQVKTESTE